MLLVPCKPARSLQESTSNSDVMDCLCTAEFASVLYKRISSVPTSSRPNPWRKDAEIADRSALSMVVDSSTSDQIVHLLGDKLITFIVPRWIELLSRKHAVSNNSTLGEVGTFFGDDDFVSRRTPSTIRSIWHLELDVWTPQTKVNVCPVLTGTQHWRSPSMLTTLYSEHRTPSATTWADTKESASESWHFMMTSIECRCGDC